MTTVLITTSSFGERDNDAVAALTAANISLVLNPLGRRLTEDEAQELLGKHNPVGIVAGVEPLTERVLSAAPSLKARRALRHRDGLRRRRRGRAARHPCEPHAGCACGRGGGTDDRADLCCASPHRRGRPRDPRRRRGSR